MPTLAGLRRRGVPPEAIRDFVKPHWCCESQQHRRHGDAGIFHPRAFEQDRASAHGGAAPAEVVIENYPESASEGLEAANYPEDATAGTRRIRFGRELFIERDDFMENPPKQFFRLSPGTEVRLRYPISSLVARW